MTDLEQLSEAEVLDLARESVYRFLSSVAVAPYSPGWERTREPEGHKLAVAAMDTVRAWAEQHLVPLTFGESGPAALDLRAIVIELQCPLAELCAEHDRVFGLVIPKECPPYETEYHPPAQTFLRSQQLADIAGFYRAFGVEPGGAIRDRPDHVALELEFVALLLTKKRLALGGHALDPSPSALDVADVCDRAVRDFVHDHLAWWVPAFATGLRRKAAGRGLYAALADALAAWIPAERQLLNIDPPFKVVEPALVEPPEEQSGCAECALLS